MSFRTRLILLNSLVVLFTLLAAGGFLVWQTRNVFMQSLDRDMIQRATRSPAFPRNGPLGQGQFGGGPNGGPGGRPGGGPDGFQRGRPNGLIRNNDDVGRPAAFDIEGKSFFDDEKRILDPDALKVRELQEPIVVTKNYKNVPTRIVTVPIREGGRFLGYVQIGHDLADFDRIKQTQGTVALILIPFVLLTSGLLGAFLAERALKPVKEVADAAERITFKDLNTKLEVHGKDELARLAGTFNSMLERLQGSFAEREKLIQDLEVSLEMQKRFVADASHELRTPLSRLRVVTSSALTQDSSESEVRRALEIADQAGISMTSLVEQLLALARLEGVDRTNESSQVNAVVKEAVEPFGTRVTLGEVGEGSVVGRHSDLVRALTNLLQNADRYTPEDGKIVVEAKMTETEWVLSVADSGVGIAPEHLHHLGNRFYRVDEARNRKDGGSGLGLSIVRSIVEGLGGSFHVTSAPEKGTRVSLHLPKAKVL